MVDNNVVEDPEDNDEIRLWGFNFNLFDKNQSRGEGKRNIE